MRGKGQGQQIPGSFEDVNRPVSPTQYEPDRLLHPRLELHQCLTAHSARRYRMIAFMTFAVVTDGNGLDRYTWMLVSNGSQEYAFGTDTYGIGSIFLIGAYDQYPRGEPGNGPDMESGIWSIRLSGHGTGLFQQLRIRSNKLCAAAILLPQELKLLLLHPCKIR